MKLPVNLRFMANGGIPSGFIEFIIIILAPLVISALIVLSTTALQKTPRAKALADIKTIEHALGIYYLDTGHYPDTLDALIKKPDKEKNWRTGGYLGKIEVLKDPWGNAYSYTRAEENVYIVTYGRDGRPGGTGYDADISNKAPHQYDARNQYDGKLSWVELSRIMRWSCVY